MATVKINKLGVSNPKVLTITIREESEGSSVNRYLSGTVPGTLTFTPYADGLDHKYVVTVNYENCAAETITFRLAEPCKGNPSTVVTPDCTTTPTLKIRSTLSNATTVRVKIYNGTNLVKNQVIQGGIETSITGLPSNVPLRIVTEHPEFANCKNEITQTLTCDCTFTIVASSPQGENSIPDPEPNPGNDFVTTYFARTDYDTKQVDLWKNVGYFEGTYPEGQTVVDWIAHWPDAVFLDQNNNQRLSNLGFRKTGSYGDPVRYLAKEAPTNRYQWRHQTEFERTTPPLHEYLIDNSPYRPNRSFTLDSGEVFTPTDFDYQERIKWSMIWAWFHRSENDTIPSDIKGMVRWNNEGHSESNNLDWWKKARYIIRGGMYLPAREGGNNTNKNTGETRLPGEPDYSAMSDDQYVQYFRQKVLDYGVWLYSSASDQGIQAIGYDLDTKAGFLQSLPSPGSQWNDVSGYRKDPMWHSMVSSENGKRLTDVLWASNYGWLDLHIKPSPTHFVYPGRTYVAEGTTYMEFCDFGLAENTTPKDVVTAGAPEFYRFSVNRNDSTCSSKSSVTIRFEDRDGNLRRSTELIRAESATDDYRPGQATMTTHDIPAGTHTFKYCHHVPLGERWTTYSLEDFSDERILVDWEYANFNYFTNNGKPFHYQIYCHALVDRYPNIGNETTNGGQLPKSLCYGLKFLAYTFNINHILYYPVGYTGILSMQNFAEANKIVKKYEPDHFKSGQVKWVPIEISMDNGATWTDANPIVKRNDIVPTEADGFYAMSQNGYGSKWVNDRRAQKKPSPMTLVTYNTVTRSYVIFEKAMFGDVVVYDFRVKEPNGQYKYFRNRVLDRKWKDSIVTPVE